MGCGLSKVEPSALPPENSQNAFFVSAELNEAAKIFVKDASARAAFVQYLKGGVWLELIAKIDPHGNKTTNGSERPNQRKNSAIFEYEAAPNVDLGQVLTEAAMSKAESLFKTLTLSPRASPAERSSSGATKHNSMDSRDECYAPLEDICGMSEVQLVAIMTGIVFPMFMESPEWKSFKEGSFSDLERSISSKQSAACLTKSSKRAQELLLSCAARFDEDTLLHQLEEPAWLTVLQNAFQDFPLPISVCDTNRDACPLVYVNKAFEELVGMPRRKLLGKRLNVLNGPGTQLALFERILEAQRCNLPCKVAISHYGAEGEKFLDLLAMRPSGGYSFAVHCPAHRHTLADDLRVSNASHNCHVCGFLLTAGWASVLQMVDDALMLLSHVVKAPPVRKLQRGQSWVPNINNLRAMSRHLHL
jgi:PAS domain-containing protein